VTVKLFEPFDGLAAGTKVILKLQALSLGPTTVGTTLAYSGLRRLGKTSDGLFLYCGRGQASKFRPPE